MGKYSSLYCPVSNLQIFDVDLNYKLNTIYDKTDVKEEDNHGYLINYYIIKKRYYF